MSLAHPPGSGDGTDDDTVERPRRGRPALGFYLAQPEVQERRRVVAEQVEREWQQYISDAREHGLASAREAHLSRQRDGHWKKGL